MMQILGRWITIVMYILAFAATPPMVAARLGLPSQLRLKSAPISTQDEAPSVVDRLVRPDLFYFPLLDCQCPSCGWEA
jgi:hypothetical protein